MMKAAVLHGPRDLRIEDVPTPALSEGNVLVRVHSVGICGSDVHYYESGRIGDFVVEQPMILGHESSGVVVEVGPGVTDVQVGDRVALEPGVPCRVCEWCKTGKYNLCPRVRFMATPPVNGALCEYVSMPEDFVYPLPPSVGFAEGALCEPMSVAIHTLRRVGFRAGQSVLITGAGPIGLVTTVAARAFGAADVFVSEVAENRRAAALQMGASAAFDPTAEDVAAATAAAVGVRRGGNWNRFPGVDVAVECSGNPQALAAAIGAVKRGGKVALVGLGPETTQPVPLVDLAAREIDLVTVFRYANTYGAALALIASGRICLNDMITHYFPLVESESALRFASAGLDGAIKVMVQVGSE